MQGGSIILIWAVILILLVCWLGSARLREVSEMYEEVYPWTLRSVSKDG